MTFLFSDPGRVSADLEDRGLLEPVLHGDIPKAMAHLPLCPHCSLPCPPQSHHCATCQCCLLRRDFHSSFGRCVADRNFKAYFLNFFWGTLLGVATFVFNIGLCTGENNIFASFGLMFASALLVVYFMVSGLLFLLTERKDASWYDRISMRSGRKVPVREIIDSFGDSCWKKLVPTQKTATKLAWPGIDWM
jgi:hypothetical protein